MGVIRAVTRSSNRERLRESVEPVTEVAEAARPVAPLESWTGTFALEKLRRWQREDVVLGRVRQWIADGVRPEASSMASEGPALRHYWNLWDSLVMRGELLFRNFTKRDGTGVYLQLMVPDVMKNDVLRQMHDALLAGHLGVKKTKEKVLQRFYWFEFREDIRLYIQRCDKCSAVKESAKTPKAPMQPMTVGATMDRLATDILGPLPVTPRGNKYILLVTDHFSKWVEVLPVPDQKATTCAGKILNEVIARFGCPYDLHSDQGRNYDGTIFAELSRLLEVRKTRTSPRNPRCNGLAERFNRTLLKMIKSYLRGEQDDWDLHLGCLAGAYRASPHASTGLSPNLIMLGREVRLPAEVAWGSLTRNEGEIGSYGEYVALLREKMQRAHQVARRHLQVAAKRQKSGHDIKMSLNKYKPGDAVWYLAECRKKGLSPKLQPAYEGPFVIRKRLNNLNYMIQKDRAGKKRVVVHHNKLKEYTGLSPPRWAAALRGSA